MRNTMLLILVLLTAVQVSFCQSDKSVFVEVLGNGVGASVNFDTRLSQSDKGFGVRVGLGVFPGTIVNAPFLTIPIGVNHLAGKAPHYFESGLGVTFMPGIKAFWDDELRASGLLFIPSVGYRYARKSKGFQGRIFISPWIGNGGAFFMAGLSAGYHF